MSKINLAEINLVLLRLSLLSNQSNEEERRNEVQIRNTFQNTQRFLVLVFILPVHFLVIESFDYRMVGLRTGESLEPLVHSKLGESAKQASKAVEDFGVSVENLLMKHGKRIIGQFPSILITNQLFFSLRIKL